MDRHSLPSVEKFAAFLDGNLSQDEMQQVLQQTEHDQVLHQILGASSVVDETLSGYSSDDLQLPEEIDSPDFRIPDVEDRIDFVGFGDSFDESHTLYNHESINHVEESMNNHDYLSELRIYGEEGNESGNEYNPQIDQFYPDTCAIRSQQIVLRDYGIDISQERLILIAQQNGWYFPEMGTPINHVGQLLNIAGVECHQSYGNTIYDITNELAQGHRIIIGVDSGELWAKNVFERFAEKVEDAIGIKGADHALIVAGVEVNPNNHNDVKVVLTDPGRGNLRIEYGLSEFVDAWKDSNCFMVSTEEPAPYQYDSLTNMEVPSGFNTDFEYNSFVMDNGFQLSPDFFVTPNTYLASYSEDNGISFSHHDCSDGTSIIEDINNDLDNFDSLD